MVIKKSNYLRNLLAKAARSVIFVSCEEEKNHKKESRKKRR